jgi:hypothetical protein
MGKMRRKGALIATLVFSSALCSLAIAPQHEFRLQKPFHPLPLEHKFGRIPLVLRIRGAGEDDENKTAGLGARMMDLASEAGAVGFDIGAAMRTHQAIEGSALQAAYQQAAERAMQAMLELCQKAMDECYDG